MRFLSVLTFEFHEFYDSQIPPYAILSHRWEEEEVTYQDMMAGARWKKGFEKIRECCLQAHVDGFDYVWIDTCCIDKSSSAELSEAINSMYKWYQRSAVCYAYLSDVRPDGSDRQNWIRQASSIEAFLNSKWWTRGWTLQELIAPSIVKFFGQGVIDWIEIGSKASLVASISSKTGIDEETLHGQDVRKASIARRMSWTSTRQTTRSEDMAYCLLGIFGVNMPLLYGEGNRAFLRLQVQSVCHFW
ncbi:heterokaryon incompatibility protein-domain-containing protein [Clohesyomyces aquaticus]|uniref:Heterokaryon incompatibility protein-domain-containing protein n=1 Tax=Clohesyomyces aquaticus TaxID=1231657 RepID=A0A1Y1ZFG1_9PLEO|nr:heterokaryon incompatibility protein-domain-containing protein [Clohesyomyces aquaticus]